VNKCLDLLLLLYFQIYYRGKWWTDSDEIVAAEQRGRVEGLNEIQNHNKGSFLINSLPFVRHSCSNHHH